MYKDEHVVVFHDIHPKASAHVLIVPIKHLDSMNAVTEADINIVGKMFVVAPFIAGQLGVKDSGYKLLVNVGEGAGQVVPHAHMHLLGDRKE